MNVSQAHRGPDGEGVQEFVVADGYLSFGHRRLAILDLSPAGQQPMRDPETGVVVVFNGEIYNYRQLRGSLKSAAASFRSSSDTEVVLRAYVELGPECFVRFQGMFALAIYDPRNQALVLARDPLGIKPLYYGWGPRAFVFGSEIRAIRASGAVDTTLDSAALATTLAYGAVQAPLTINKNVRCLAPGAWATLDLRDRKAAVPLSPRRYWRAPTATASTIGRAEAVEQLRALLSEATERHLVSDVPVGLFLSGGIDSTTLAVQCRQADCSVQAFTVSVEGHASTSEEALAKRTAADLGLEHQSVRVTVDDALGTVEEFLSSMDQPTVDGLNTFIVAKAVRERGVKVALSGLGGDELFGGYSSFREVPQLQWWKAFAAGRIPQQVQQVIAPIPWWRGTEGQRQKAREYACDEPVLSALYLRRRRLLSDKELAGIGLRAEALSLGRTFLPSEAEPRLPCLSDDPRAVIGELETDLYMGNTLLRDSDVFGMAHGLEIRVPFLHTPLVEFVTALPAAIRFPAGDRPKKFLVDAVGSLMPAEVARRQKSGFSLPQASWLSGPLRAPFQVGVDFLVESGMVDAKGIANIWNAFQRDPSRGDWSHAWILGVVGDWCRRNST